MTPAFPIPPTSRDDVAAYALFYADVIYVRAKTTNGWVSVPLTEIEDDVDIAAFIDIWWERRVYPTRLVEGF